MNSETGTPSTLKQLKIDRSNGGPGKKKKIGRWLILAGIIIATAGYILKPGKTEVQVTSVITTYPSQQYAQLTASGYVVAQTRAAVASKATGRLVQLNVREGSQVKKGDLLAQLDASDIVAAKTQAQASIRQAEAGVAQANVELMNAEVELKRSLGLQSQGFISAQAIDTAKNRVAMAKAAYQSAKMGVGVAQSALKVQQVNQDYTEIRAPFDGVVLVKMPTSATSLHHFLMPQAVKGPW